MRVRPPRAQHHLPRHIWPVEAKQNQAKAHKRGATDGVLGAATPHLASTNSKAGSHPKGAKHRVNCPPMKPHSHRLRKGSAVPPPPGWKHTKTGHQDRPGADPPRIKADASTESQGAGSTLIRVEISPSLITSTSLSFLLNTKNLVFT